MGRPAVRPVVSHLLGGAGHRVVPHNGDIDQGVGAKPLQPGPERAAAGQTQWAEAEEAQRQRWAQPKTH